MVQDFLINLLASLQKHTYVTHVLTLKDPTTVPLLAISNVSSGSHLESLYF